MEELQQQEGVLVTTDEQTVVYLVEQNAARVGTAKFILAQLDARNVFVKRERLAWVQQTLEARMNANIFEDGEPKGR
jgi:hypothetical protein